MTNREDETGKAGISVAIAPDWVPVKDIPKWIKEYFQFEPSPAWMRKLWETVRRLPNLLPHRVGDMEKSVYYSYRNWLPGLATSDYYDGGVVVCDWDAAGFDSGSFTVSGVQEGRPFRAPVQLRWSNLHKWVNDQIESDLDHRPPETYAPPVASLKRSKTATGRPPKFKWDIFWMEVAHYTAANDLQSNNRQELQAHMVDFCAREWESPPDDSTIREKIAALYAHKPTPVRKRV